MAYTLWSGSEIQDLALDYLGHMKKNFTSVKEENSVSLSTALSGVKELLNAPLSSLTTVFKKLIEMSMKRKIDIREFLLGKMEPYELKNHLLKSSLSCPGIFPIETLEQALPLLQKAQDDKKLKNADGFIYNGNRRPANSDHRYNAGKPIQSVYQQKNRTVHSSTSRQQSFRPYRKHNRRPQSFRLPVIQDFLSSLGNNRQRPPGHSYGQTQTSTRGNVATRRGTQNKRVQSNYNPRNYNDRAEGRNRPYQF